MISKELFVKSIDDIEKQVNRDREISDSLDTVLRDGYNNSVIFSTILINSYIKLLKELTNDEDDNIEYFMWELDFGKKANEYVITEQDGNIVKLLTPELLYDFIEKYNK